MSPSEVSRLFLRDVDLFLLSLVSVKLAYDLALVGVIENFDLSLQGLVGVLNLNFDPSLALLIANI